MYCNKFVSTLMAETPLHGDIVADNIYADTENISWTVFDFISENSLKIVCIFHTVLVHNNRKTVHNFWTFSLHESFQHFPRIQFFLKQNLSICFRDRYVNTLRNHNL